MNDKELITLIALIWVQHGGDKLGFELSTLKIAEKIEKLEKEKEEK